MSSGDAARRNCASRPPWEPVGLARQPVRLDQERQAVLKRERRNRRVLLLVVPGVGAGRQPELVEPVVGGCVNMDGLLGYW